MIEQGGSVADVSGAQSRLGYPVQLSSALVVITLDLQGEFRCCCQRARFSSAQTTDKHDWQGQDRQKFHKGWGGKKREAEPPGSASAINEMKSTWRFPGLQRVNAVVDRGAQSGVAGGVCVSDGTGRACQRG